MIELETKYQVFARFVREKAKKGSAESLLEATPSKILLLFPELISALFAEVNREAGLVRRTAFVGPKDMITFPPTNELLRFEPDEETETIEARLIKLIQVKLNLQEGVFIKLFPFTAALNWIDGFFVLIFQSENPQNEEIILQVKELLDYLGVHIENLCLKSRFKELTDNYKTVSKGLSSKKISPTIEIDSILRNIQESAFHIFQARFSVLLKRDGNSLVAISKIGHSQSFDQRHSDNKPYTVKLYDTASIPDTQIFEAEFYRDKIKKQMMGFLAEEDFEEALAIPVSPFGKYTYIIALFFEPLETQKIAYYGNIAPFISGLASSSIESTLNKITLTSATNELVQVKKKTSDLIHLTNLVSSTLDVNHSLNIASKKIRELFDADRCSIIIQQVERKEGVIQFSSSRDASVEEPLGMRLNEEECPYLFSPSLTKKPLVLDSIDTLQLNVKERGLLHALNVKKMLLVPVFKQGDFIGLLTIDHVMEEKNFSDSDIEFASAVANQISSAISNARLFTDILKSKNEWELTFNSISDGIFVIDMEHNITNFNRVFAEKHGFDPAKIMGKKCYELFPCKRVGTEECGHSKCIDLKKPIETIHHSYMIPGTFRVTISPVFDENGEVEKSVHFITDITKEIEYEKQLEESLKKAQEISNYLETLIESSPDSIISTDEKGNIAYFSKGASELLGYDPEKICGEHVSKLYPTLDDAKKVGQMMHKNSGKLRNHNTLLKKKEGALVEVLLSVSTLFDEKGNRVGTVGISKDLSRMKRMEEYIRQAEKLTALGKLASGIAHDFNNILAAISMRAELMKLKTKNPEILKDLELIENSAHTGADTVNKLRSFYKRDRKEFGQVDINDVIKDAMEITSPRWKDMSYSKGIVIEMDLDLEDGLSTIQGNEGELKDVFINLIINALDAMPKGGKIKIRTQKVNNSIKTIFTDSGVGMKPRIRDRAFEPFFSTKGDKGSGLGLSTVYGIITSHGGQVELESWTGKGTSFIIHFPVSEKETKRESLEDDSRYPDIGGTTVIVFEDEVMIKDSLKDLLKQRGCNVIEFDNSRKGLKFLEENLSSLSSENKVAIITDLGMPEINGLEIARKAKSLDDTVPVIMITGWGSFIEPSQVNIYGVDRIISKPLRSRVLIKAIGELVK